MRKYIFYLAAPALFLLSAGIGWGAHHIRFKGISLEDGQCHSVVTAIFQDQRGFMWFGTRDGLCRYDGYRFTSYKNEPYDARTISNNYITAIAEDHSGTLWIGTNGGGLNRFNRKKEAFSSYRHDPGDRRSISCDRVKALFTDISGSLWVGTDNGLDKFLEGEFSHYSRDAVRCIYEAPSMKGILWIATVGGGLIKFNTASGASSRYRHDPQGPLSIGSNDITSICEDSADALWVGTESHGLDRLDVKGEIFSHYTLSDDRVMCLHKDRDGVLWVGTDGGGLCYLSRDSKGEMGFVNFKFNPLRPNGLRHNEVLCLHEDRGKVLWVGTDGRGLSYCRKLPFRLYEKNPTLANSLNCNDVFALLEDRQGHIWIGTDEGGLNRYDPRNEAFTYYRHSPHDRSSLSRDEVLCLCEGRGGLIWVGTDGGGLNHLDPTTGEFTRYQPKPGDPDSISDAFVCTIIEDRDGVLWIGTFQGGLDRLDRARQKFSHYRHDPGDPYSLSHDSVRAICQSAVEPDILWVGTRGGGLNRFDRKSGRFSRFKHNSLDKHSLSSNDVLSIYEDSSGTLWIGTEGGGLNRFDRQGGTFKAWTEAGGLPNNTIYGILEGDNGDLWLSSNKGLIRLNPRTKKIKNYDASDGLQSKVFNIGAWHKGASGRLYFGGINGFNVFKPTDVTDDTARDYSPPVAITSFMVFNKKYNGENSISEAKEIELNYTDNYVSFEFALLDFWAPEKNKYTYRMEGVDKGWRHVGIRNFASYTNLSPGTYNFRVRGENHKGESSKETSLKLRIIPPFWKTWWFYLLSLILFAVASYLIIHLTKKYLLLITYWKKRNYIGNYKVVDKIGSGGIGVVYKAHKLTDKDQIFALKVLKEEYLLDERQKRRFKHEALLADQLDHPNIVKIFERGEDNENLYIVMELLTGKSLADRIYSLALADSIHILIQIADVLVKLHGKDIVHRDLTPNNIMLVEKEGDPNFVKILDFGLARAQHFTKLTETGHLFGTVAYMPPEYIFKNRISIEGDIYSLGIIFYEMLTHHQPFKGESTMEMLKQIFDHNPPEPIEVMSGIPGEINDLVMDMIEEEPEDRPTAKEVLELLKHFSSVVEKQ
jgi:ligand-binding sensor domain-containing protein